MSARGKEVTILAAGTTPAITSTALTAFKAYGNTVTLYITTVTGGAGTLTLTVKSSKDGTNYFDVYDLDSAASWTINVNSAGLYELTIPLGTIPNNYYKFYYSCGVAAGTIGIDAVSWENPAGSLDVNVGDIHADVGTVGTVGAYKPIAYSATGSAAISYTTTFPGPVEVSHLTLHLSAAGTTTENFDISLDAADGAAYDTLLFRLNLASGSVTDLVVPAQTMGISKLDTGDQIKVTWPNTETRTYGINIVARQL